jgi:hypothetical protein
LWIQLLSDVAAGVFEVLPLTDSHYELAEQLIGQYAFQFRLRTLDALQLAVALDRNERAALNGFVLADQALSDVAVAEKVPAILLV